MNQANHIPHETQNRAATSVPGESRTGARAPLLCDPEQETNLETLQRSGIGVRILGTARWFGRAVLIFATFAAFAGPEFPPLPPGYKPALRSPRQLTTTAGRSMSRSVIAPPATNAPAMLVIRGWDTFAGERVPRLALRFGTNAPHATIFTRTYGADWRCFTTLDGIINGSVRDFGWCPTPGSAGNLPAASAQLFKVVLHD